MNAIATEVSPLIRMRSTAGATLILAVLVGCGSASANHGSVCIDIGRPTGIGIDVAPEIAGSVGGPVQLTACWDGACHQASVLGLSPSTRSVDQGCTPNGSCSAAVVPTGGKNGFGSIAGLPAKPVQVTLTIPAAGRGGRSVTGSLTVTPELLVSGDPNCRPVQGVQGVQGHITVDRSGNVVAG